MDEMRNAYKILIRDHLEDLGIDGRTVLRKQDERLWTGFMWLRIGTLGLVL
jgi:hypothetical protein